MELSCSWIIPFLLWIADLAFKAWLLVRICATFRNTLMRKSSLLFRWISHEYQEGDKCHGSRGFLQHACLIIIRSSDVVTSQTTISSAQVPHPQRAPRIFSLHRRRIRLEGIHKPSQQDPLVTMPGKPKKSTKKFEARHLKDTLERRKDFAKTKQRQQIKAKRKARNAADNAKAEDLETPPPSKKRKAQDTSQRLEAMVVDDFFQDGIEVPEQPIEMSSKKVKGIGKRKRVSDQASNDEASEESLRQEAFEDESEDGADTEGLEMSKGDLEALAEKDPEFYKHLKENDPELLDFDEDALGDLEISEDEHPAASDGKKQKSAKPKTQDITLEIVRKWEAALSEEKSLRATREVVLAFRAAAYLNSDTGREHKYSIPSPEVYHQLLIIALKHIPDVLSHHSPIKESASGKVRVATDSKKFRTISPLMKMHTASIQHLLGELSDAPTIKLTLSAATLLLPYLLSLKKVLKELTATAVGIWSNTASDESTRITAFLFMRRLAVIGDVSLREVVLKTAYQGLVKGSRVTNVHTAPGINLMKNSAAELWGLDPNIGYTTGFGFIRQLAIHLRTTSLNPTKDSYKIIYNWQYTHSVDFWSRVLSAHCSPAANPSLKAAKDSPLHPLIYPLVQITLGALRLIPTPAYFPLRFHMTRSLLRLSHATTTYIPLSASLLEVLSSAECSKPPKASTVAPLDFSVVLRAPKSYLRTRVYQDGLGSELAELLGEFFYIWSKNIAFPELIIPPTVQMKRWLKSTAASSKPNDGLDKGQRGKHNRGSKIHAAIGLLVQKLEMSARFIEEKRREVRFAPSHRVEVENFLRDLPREETPLGAYVVAEKLRRDDRERQLRDGREKEKNDKSRRSNVQEEMEDPEESE